MGLVAMEPVKVKVKEAKSKHNEVGPLPTSLAGWPHLKAASNRLHLPRGLLATEPVE